MTYELHHGDCLDVLPTLAAGSVDALVTDPPGALSFMGMAWDGDKGGRAQWVAWLAERMRAARRVVKPGHYGLVWALPRTSHWTACALEDAGWEIRDRVSHIFGSGFPKHKSALKPAVEDWWLVRNPGKGGAALNIDAARVAHNEECRMMKAQSTGHDFYRQAGRYEDKLELKPDGRWPAHLVLSHSAACNGVCAPDCPVALMDSQSGERKLGGRNITRHKATNGYDGGWGDMAGTFPLDTGGASRFFTRLDADDYAPFLYAAKASRTERNRGCEGLEAKATRDHDMMTSGFTVDRRSPNGGYENKPAPPRANHHPTVKSQALMQWLCRLITPPGGVVLDMFAGSGSTGVAAAACGFDFVGMEREAEYIPIARARLDDAYAPLAAMERAS